MTEAREKQRRRIHGIVFIVDFLFIISFFVVLDTSPGATLMIRGKAPEEQMFIAYPGESPKDRAKGSYLRISCNKTHHSVCGHGQSIVIHGELFRLIGEIFFISCGFENHVCSLVLTINEDGFIDGSRFLVDNPLGPRTSAALMEKFVQHPGLIEFRGDQKDIYMLR